MKRTTILADEELLAEAKELAAKQGISFTALVQQALRNYIAMYRLPRRISFAGMYSSGSSLTSEEMDQMLADGLDPIAGWMHDRAGAQASPVERADTGR